ncbi:hypothetical protein GMA1_16 [Gordonia phage GMA1]|uniref:hypothetical protein n=1 Tax=Gordonia phage GMA1 TaxID=1647470 RepID=UPI0007B65060|nr:hypothetical protein BH788_gp16 [Gordonia phage GMA1]AKJ72113.1 hypothetical protein GMA1_16 [Gordonia phage GMA1]
MKKWIAATAVVIGIASLSACGSSGEDAAPATVTVTSSATGEMPMVDTPECEEFCARVDRIADEMCEAGGDGAECADILTPMTLLAMKIRDSSSAAPDVRSVASDLAEKGGEFGKMTCYKQARMDMTCGMIALNVHTLMQTIQLKLHTP